MLIFSRTQIHAIMDGKWMGEGAGEDHNVNEVPTCHPTCTDRCALWVYVCVQLCSRDVARRHEHPSHYTSRRALQRRGQLTGDQAIDFHLSPSSGRAYAPLYSTLQVMSDRSSLDECLLPKWRKRKVNTCYKQWKKGAWLSPTLP